MTFIKICGITNRRDAEAAVMLGADAIGFVFVRSSPRYVEPESARTIARDLDVMTVGVFQDHDEASIRRIADESCVSAFQLHGSESPEFCARFDRPVIKAFRGPPVDGYAIFATLVDGPAHWRACDRSIIAGGLTPFNVRAAIERTRPFGVDLASGIEASPGKKDHDAMKRFFEEVRR